jgi:hypothetical protein
MRVVVDRDLLRKFWDFSRVDLSSGEKRKDSDMFCDRKDEFDKDEATTNQADLPAPLWYVEFGIVSRNKIMQYGFAINAKRKEAFRNMSGAFGRVVRPCKYKFIRNNPNLSGYIINPDGDVIADVGDDDEGVVRHVSFGQGGSKIRRYDDFQTFQADVMELECLTQHLINCCLNVEDGRRNSDMVVYLGLEF